jgi:eukaryotic-like serine/threonine-protein kinase
MNRNKTELSTSHDSLQPSHKETEAAPQSIETSIQTTLHLSKTKERKRDPYRLVGITLGNKYRLEEYAGGGGMGAVYRCYHTELAQVFAIKILKPDIVVNNPIYARLFEREVEAARQLNHPNIVKLFDSGFDDNVSFMVMEWLEGHTLEDVIDDGHLGINRVAAIFNQICSAFIAAHNKNVIHLDIKPANVFIVDSVQLEDFVKVIDFGLARVLRSDSGTTVTRFLGTYQYCSPEHFGGKLTHRSDIYSLGVMLYQLLTGVLPFGTSHIQAKMYPNLEMPPIPSLRRIRPDLSDAVDKVILKALSKDPNGRQQSVQQLLQEFSASISTLLTTKANVALLSNDKADAVSVPPSSPAIQQAAILPQLAKNQSVAHLNQRNWKFGALFALIIMIATIAIIMINRNRSALISIVESHTPAIDSTDPEPNQQDQASENITAQTWSLKETLTDHKELVWSVAFSPDGSTLASSSQDNTVKLWDVKTWLVRRTLPVYMGDGAHDHVVAFSADGNLLASGNDDRIVIWDAQTGGLKMMLKGHEDTVNYVAFSPDRRMLASASGDKTVKLWDLQSEQPVRTILVCPGECLAHGVNSVTFSPDGKTLATGDSNNDVKLWSVETGLLKRQMRGHKETVWTVAFSPNGETLASASGDGTVRLWDVNTGELKRILVGHTAQVWSVAFTLDGNLIASGSFDTTVKLWNPRTGKLKQTLAGHKEAIHGIAFSPDGRTLASASNDNTIKLWSITK